MKKLLSLLLLVWGLFSSCASEKEILVGSVKLQPSSLSLVVGDEAVLEAAVSPEDASNPTISWSVEHPSIASVDNGKVKALSPGETIVKVITEDGGKTASCQVVVKEKVWPVESVSLNKSELELTEGDSFILEAAVLPENATDKTVFWVSDAAEVASVQEGKVTGLTPGTATITVKTGDGGKTASCKVTVKEKVVPTDQIWYTTTDNAVVEPDGKLVLHFGANLLSNVYENGKGILSFDKPATLIGSRCFKDKTRLTTVKLPASLKEIQTSAFQGCSNLQKINLPEGIDAMSYQVFEGCSSLTEIVLPTTVTEMRSYAFKACTKLEEIHLPEGLLKINSWVFNECDALSEVTLPSTLTFIGFGAFNNCDKLKKVYCKSINVPKGANKMFSDCTSQPTIYVPKESVEQYKKAEYWAQYADFIVGYDFKD